MDLFLLQSPSPRDKTQGRLLGLAVIFLFLFALILTLAPAGRLRSWNAPFNWEHWIGFVVWLGAFIFIHRETSLYLPDRDPFLVPLAAILSGWGLLTIWRLDLVLGVRQALWLVFGLAIFWLAIRRPGLLTLLRRYKYLELTSGLLLTALTFIFGTYPGGVGPRLWLGCCGVYLQPSEPLKLLLIVYLAAYLADRLPVGLNLMELLKPTLILAGAALVILVAQRDLGTATLFILLYSIVIYMASGRQRILVISALAILAASLAGYQLFDVIRIRVNAWVNPWIDPAGRSYQIVQSLISIAAGGVFGSGPGMGSPSLVPVSHSDFIFAAITEETGLIGALGLLLIIGLLAMRGMRAALRAPNNYQRYLAAGLTTYLAAQAILIIGGNLRLLPLTGVTLPFVSYGGSSLVTSLMSVLILALISNTGESEPAPLPSAQPYLITSAALLAGLAAIALVAGWWGYLRSDALIARADNPRRFVSDRYVKRGALLDRNNRQLDVSEGQPGSYTRQSLYPPLAATTGYVDPTYGQGGLEASQDGYLRGTEGNPSSAILSNFLLYSQPPPGLNVRTSLDLELQKLADSMMDAHKGALVLLNARTGEVLVMASHPYFDPNQIEGKWDEWLNDKNAPLLNRATQGQFSPGTAIGPFLLAAASGQGAGLPPLPEQLSFSQDGTSWTCAQPPPSQVNWDWAASNGCPAALITLFHQIGSTRLGEIFTDLGFYQSPDIPLPGVQPVKPGLFTNPELAALGEDNVHVTPLQMALAAAVISTNGVRPAPRLVTAVQTSQQGWVILPSKPAQQSMQSVNMQTAAHMLAVEGKPYWQSLGSGLTSNSRVTWYTGGTQPDMQGAPLAIALVLEEDNAQLAQKIGQALLDAALSGK